MYYIIEKILKLTVWIWLLFWIWINEKNSIFDEIFYKKCYYLLKIYGRLAESLKICKKVFLTCKKLQKSEKHKNMYKILFL